jgi:hypothetical protein
VLSKGYIAQQLTENCVSDADENLPTEVDAGAPLEAAEEGASNDFVGVPYGVDVAETDIEEPMEASAVEDAMGGILESEVEEEVTVKT